MQGNQTPQNRDYQPRQECGGEQNGYVEVHDVHDNSALRGRCRCASAMSPNACKGGACNDSINNLGTYQQLVHRGFRVADKSRNQVLI